MASFEADVQYNDWKGTCAADNSDHGSLSSMLLDSGQLAEDESIVALNFYMHYADRVYAHAYAIPLNTLTATREDRFSPVLAREIDFELTTQQFFKMFKRFDIVLTDPGLDIQGREYSVGERS